MGEKSRIKLGGGGGGCGEKDGESAPSHIHYKPEWRKPAKKKNDQLFSYLFSFSLFSRGENYCPKRYLKQTLEN